MSTLKLNGKSLASQTSSDEPVIASTVTGGAGLSGMTSLGTVTTGTLGSGVTFPAGHIIQTKTDTVTGIYQGFNNNTPTAISGFNVSMPVRSASSKILIMLALTGAGKSNGTTLAIKITESTTSLDVVYEDIHGYTSSTATNYGSVCCMYEHTHGQSAGTTLTYTPKFYSGDNLSLSVIGNYLGVNDRPQTITIFEVMQ